MSLAGGNTRLDALDDAKVETLDASRVALKLGIDEIEERVGLVVVFEFLFHLSLCFIT